MIAEDGVGRLIEMGAEGELVAHCAGEDEDSRLMLGDLCEIRFEGIGCGVFGKDIVEESRVLDGCEHGFGGGGYYITWIGISKSRGLDEG